MSLQCLPAMFLRRKQPATLTRRFELRIARKGWKIHLPLEAGWMNWSSRQSLEGERKELVWILIHIKYILCDASLFSHIQWSSILPHSPPLPSALPHSVYGVNVGFTFSVYLNLSFLLQCSRGKALTLCLLSCIWQTVEKSRHFSKAI